MKNNEISQPYQSSCDIKHIDVLLFFTSTLRNRSDLLLCNYFTLLLEQYVRVVSTLLLFCQPSGRLRSFEL